MAYFANGTDGAKFDWQCAQCKYGEEMCPIALAQCSYNYEAVGNEVATDILNFLVKDDGTCEMFKLAEKDFRIVDTTPNL